MSVRSGILVRKMGMTQLMQSDGQTRAVTVLLLDNPQVVALRTVERDGYSAVCVGTGLAKAKRMAKPQRDFYRQNSLPLKKRVVEFRVDDSSGFDVGDEFLADHFVAGQHVDVVGTSKGKGFAGGMKRHNFKGLGASHGVSVSHRSMGSLGGCQDPGKVWKGKKMAGHMGNVRVTTQNLEVVDVNVDRGIIYVAGAVPGCDRSLIEIRDAVKRPQSDGIPFPASLKKAKNSPDNIDASSVSAGS